MPGGALVLDGIERRADQLFHGRGVGNGMRVQQLAFYDFLAGFGLQHDAEIPRRLGQRIRTQALGLGIASIDVRMLEI